MQIQNVTLPEYQKKLIIRMDYYGYSQSIQSRTVAIQNILEKRSQMLDKFEQNSSGRKDKKRRTIISKEQLKQYKLMDIQEYNSFLKQIWGKKQFDHFQKFVYWKSRLIPIIVFEQILDQLRSVNPTTIMRYFQQLENYDLVYISYLKHQQQKQQQNQLSNSNGKSIYLQDLINKCKMTIIEEEDIQYENIEQEEENIEIYNIENEGILQIPKQSVVENVF